MAQQKYVIFGIGKNGRQLAELVGYENVSCFVDNYLSDTPNFEGFLVLGFADLLKRGLQENEYIVISPKNIRHVVEIAVQLEKSGFKWLLPCDVGNMIIAKEAKVYESMNSRPTFSIREENNYYIYTDRFGSAGCTGAYFWMDFWAAKKIKQRSPNLHYDIGSRVDGFISHLMLIGQKVRMIDIRPAELNLEGVDFIQADATNLDGIEDCSVESLSALCSPEHFGLGRYGDKIDPDACFKFFSAISKKMVQGGHVYICVPVGQEHVEFNAHRIFSPQTVIDSFGEKMSLEEFSITDDKSVLTNADLNVYSNKFGIGLFDFVKRY